MSRRVPSWDIQYNPYGRQCYELTARAMCGSLVQCGVGKTGRKPIMYVPRWWAACTGSSTGFGQNTCGCLTTTPQAAAACWLEDLVVLAVHELRNNRGSRLRPH